MHVNHIARIATQADGVLRWGDVLFGGKNADLRITDVLPTIQVPNQTISAIWDTPAGSTGHRGPSFLPENQPTQLPPQHLQSHFPDIMQSPFAAQQLLSSQNTVDQQPLLPLQHQQPLLPLQRLSPLLPLQHLPPITEHIELQPKKTRGPYSGNSARTHRRKTLKAEQNSSEQITEPKVYKAEVSAKALKYREKKRKQLQQATDTPITAPSDAQRPKRKRTATQEQPQQPDNEHKRTRKVRSDSGIAKKIPCVKAKSGGELSKHASYCNLSSNLLAKYFNLETPARHRLCQQPWPDDLENPV